MADDQQGNRDGWSPPPEQPEQPEQSQQPQQPPAPGGWNAGPQPGYPGAYPPPPPAPSGWNAGPQQPPAQGGC